MDCLTSVDDESEFSGVLDIYAHHACNIHNICIYDNQDVYAKFSLTSSSDEGTLSTRIVKNGGKNPEFEERLRMKIVNPKAVLKCEIWMLSRARNYLDDQLLCFALVPLEEVVKVKELTQDFTLSSTDLFHSPAGTVKLTLSLSDASGELPLFVNSAPVPPRSSIASEVVLLDPVEYGRTIEFPDINIVKENQRMVSEYLSMPSPIVPFLHLGALSQSQDQDYDMTMNLSEDNHCGIISPNGSIHNSSFYCSTTTSMSDDRISIDSLEKKNNNVSSISHAEETMQNTETSPKTPTSKITSALHDNKESNITTGGEGSNGCNKTGRPTKLDSVFKSPMGDISVEAEQSAMQQQIVDMYMRSMQQFTESLAKMKLPMDIDKPESEDNGDVIQIREDKVGKETKKKDGSRVFYGSRAFY